MQTVKRKITKEEYDNYLELNEKGLLYDEIERNIPIEWKWGYGWYGCKLREEENENGEKEWFIYHKLGSSCD